MWLKRLQIGLIHMAVAITLVPINSTLNRVMIKELGISATVVAALVSLPYLISPIQVFIGSYADRHPILGLRRTPYIVLGLLLCTAGVLFAPGAAFLLAEGSWIGFLAGLLTFGLWGMGFNFASVSYFSLASEIDEQGRGRTIATMFFVMIVGIIVTAMVVSHLVEPYSPDALYRAFWLVGGVALAIGLLGLIRLERRFSLSERYTEERHSWIELGRAVLGNPQARLFFWYLILMLTAILGQDVLLEPFGAEAFGLPVSETTRITSIWGVCVLAMLILAGYLQTRMDKRSVAKLGNWGALVGFLVIGLSGVLRVSPVFYGGVVLLGLGTGLSTVSNLSLMLDMTTPQNVGLFIGAWGMANAISRLVGQVLSGALRDVVTLAVNNPVTGYVLVFVVEAACLAVSLVLLQRVSVAAFHRQAVQHRTLLERAALLGEVEGS